MSTSYPPLDRVLNAHRISSEGFFVLQNNIAEVWSETLEYLENRFFEYPVSAVHKKTPKSQAM